MSPDQYGVEHVPFDCDEDKPWMTEAEYNSLTPHQQNIAKLKGLQVSRVAITYSNAPLADCEVFAEGFDDWVEDFEKDPNDV